MPSSYTNLLGLVLPTTGELNGTWGAVVNANQTQFVEDAVAGYATASLAGGDWTLTTTGGGTANEARMSTLIATGSPGVPRSIFAPKLSKTYTVINKTNAVVTIKGGPSAPTTGVAVAVGKASVVVWDTVTGDFIVAGSASSGGSGGATGAGGDTIFQENATLMTTSYVLGDSAMSAGVTFTNGSANISFSNSFIAGQPVRFTTTGTLPTNFATSTVYYVIATGLTASNIQVSATLGGAAITAGSAGSGTHSCGKANNASVAGPLSVASGVTLTIPTGQRLVVL